jgi:superfamily II DNA or RNA helicase
MSLTSSRIRLRFPASRRTRGADYFRRGRVHIDDLTETAAKATVRGSRRYQVVLRHYQDLDRLQFSCTCPDASTCKHVWATLLAVEAQLAALESFAASVEASTATPANGAAAALARQGEDLDEEEDDDLDDDFDDDPDDEFEDDLEDPDEEDGDDFDHLPGRVGRRGKSRSPARRTPAPRLQLPEPARPSLEPGWQDLLRPLLSAAAPGSIQRFAYEFTLMAGAVQIFHAGGWLVCLQKCLVLKNGGLGTPRRPEFHEAQTPGAGPQDRQLLHLLEAMPRTGYGQFYGHPGVGGPMRWFQVPLELLPTVLAAMRDHPAVHHVPVAENGNPDFAKRARLVVDIDTPFQFEVGLADGNGKHAALVASYRRGAETLSLHELGAAQAPPFALLGPRVVRLEHHGSERLAQLLAERPLHVPLGELPQLLAQLAKVPGARHFLAALLEQVPLGVPTGEVSLRLPKAREAPVPVELRCAYDGTAVAWDDLSPLVPDAVTAIRRDFAAEQRLRQQVLAAGLSVHPAGLQCRREQVPELTKTLLALGCRVLAEGKPLRPWLEGKAQITSSRDWFEVAGEFQFAGASIAMPELLRRRQTPEGFVELGDGSFGMLPESWQRRIEALRALGGTVEGTAVRLRSAQALLLDALLDAEDDGGLRVDRQFAALRAKLRAFAAVAPMAPPVQFQGELRPYQQQGLGWLHFLREFGLGGCLADDMGLGKTVQVLALLAAVHGAAGKRKLPPSLLVAPRSVVPNWRAEAQRFAPGLRVLDFSGADRWQVAAGELATADLVLTTYGVVRTDAARFQSEQRRFHCAILDEAQMAKNADSQTSKAVRLLAADHRLALTGTPVENHLGELWSLFEFLNPGMFGKVAAFRDLFAAEQVPGALAARATLVQRALRPVLLRRTKSQVLTDLPPKIEQTLWCDMEPDQQRRYDELRRHYRHLLLEGAEAASARLGDQQRFVVLEALLRLRQVACHEGLVEPKLRAASSAKFDVLLPRLLELAQEGHKVLVFSQFTSLLDLLAPRLGQLGVAFERLDGQTRDRAARVARFQQDGGAPVFLVSLKAGGTGLNLTAADYVFLLDPWWNPAVELQAIDRAHRIGQRRTVNAYRLVCRGTVEERVLELQAEKRALCEAILGNERSLLQDLTRQDLELLLR